MNTSIFPFCVRFAALVNHRRPFVESLDSYGAALLLLPALSYPHNTPLSLLVTYTLEDFQSPARTIFFNPKYLTSLASFWHSRGVDAVRLSTGLMMASLALELCDNVHLYGFWPFSVHPHSCKPLTNHYYDNKKSTKKFHAMPVEFDRLLQLHRQGVLRVYLGQCPPSDV